MGSVKRKVLIGALGLLIIAAALAAGLLGSAKENGDMDTVNGGLTNNSGKPAIDVAAPDRTLTATFALG
ncbi:hypothetical protein ACFLX5_02150 [Chloroflexota bacterium]